MTVVESYFAGTSYEVTPKRSDLPDDLVNVLKLNIAVNSIYTSKLLKVLDVYIYYRNTLLYDVCECMFHSPWCSSCSCTSCVYCNC